MVLPENFSLIADLGETVLPFQLLPCVTVRSESGLYL